MQYELQYKWSSGNLDVRLISTYPERHQIRKVVSHDQMLSAERRIACWSNLQPGKTEAQNLRLDTKHEVEESVSIPLFFTRLKYCEEG